MRVNSFEVRGLISVYREKFAYVVVWCVSCVNNRSKFRKCTRVLFVNQSLVLQVSHVRVQSVLQ